MGTDDMKTTVPVGSVRTYEPEKDPRLTAGNYKWQAGPGFLFCQKVAYEPNKSTLVLPGNKTKDACYVVLSIGPDVVGYNEGDIISIERGGETGYGVFVRVLQNGSAVCGRLVPNDAPNSAVAVPTRGGVTVPTTNGEVDGKSIVEAMTAAD
jgi:hypothetical protein